jgi:hypothetical protein
MVLGVNALEVALGRKDGGTRVAVEYGAKFERTTHELDARAIALNKFLFDAIWVCGVIIGRGVEMSKS